MEISVSSLSDYYNTSQVAFLYKNNIFFLFEFPSSVLWAHCWRQSSSKNDFLILLHIFHVVVVAAKTISHSEKETKCPIIVWIFHRF